MAGVDWEQRAVASFGLTGKRVGVAGHGGMVGQALVRRLASESCEVVTAPRRETDLRDPAAVRAFVAQARPQAIFMAAAKVGGILANDTRPAEFIYDNLMIEANITETAYRGGVEKMLFCVSSALGCDCPPEHALDQMIRPEGACSRASGGPGHRALRRAGALAANRRSRY